MSDRPPSFVNLSERIVSPPSSKSPWLAIGVGVSVPVITGLVLGFGKVFKNDDGTLNTKKSLIVGGIVSLLWMGGVFFAHYKNYL